MLPIAGACVDYSIWCVSPRHQSFPFKCFDVHDCDWQFSWQSFFLIQIFEVIADCSWTSTMILDTIGSSHAVLKLVHQRIGCSAWCWDVYRLPRSQSKTTRRRTWAWSCNQNFVHMWFSLSSLIPSIWGIANEFCLHTPSSDTKQLALSSLSTYAAS
jgi:hypothetical protein